jgi:glycosyltransferase involved in cell wall biosynthesis
MTRIIHVQPALPFYRVDFFDRLAAQYGDVLEVWYSPSDFGILNERADHPFWARRLGPISSPLPGLLVQNGVDRISVEKGDIVVVSGNARNLSALALLFRARRVGASIIWWGHHWSSTSLRWRQRLRYLPMAMADAILFYTDDEVEAFYAEGAKPRKRTLVAALNNGIDIEPIRNLRRSYIATERERALLFIGRLTAKSKLRIGLDALALLGEAAPVLHVIGDGEDKHDLILRADELELGDKIVWHGATTDEANIAAVANRCLAFLYPGEVGLSLIHAMAYSLPAIVHGERRRHMPEIAAFREGQTGQVFAKDDPRSLAETIRYVLSDDSRLEHLSAGASNVVGPTYTTENMAARFVALIDQLEVNK